MFSYVLKRLVFFIPTMLIISVLTFALSKLAPGDPVKLALGNRDTGEAGGASEKIAGEKAYIEMAEQLGLTLPTFYVEFSSKASPDTLYRFVKKPERDNLERLISIYGNWPQIEAYYNQIPRLQLALLRSKQDSTTFEPGRIVRENCGKLLLEYKDRNVSVYVSEVVKASSRSALFSEVHAEALKLQENYNRMKAEASPGKNYIPDIKWYGFNNQYHRWITNFLKLDFGISYIDKRPVWSKIKDALPWTLSLNIIAILISYLIAIPVGVYSARHKDSLMDRIVTIKLFILNSLPVFWIATLLITFLTTEEYGMDWFPTFGLGDVTEDMGWMEIAYERGIHFILPVFCLTYGSLAYLSRQMRGGVLSVLRQDYIRTARAKGLAEGTVMWKHAFRNSLIPIITIFASLFPAAISGAFIIENIFSIPGMGKVAFEGLVARDYPMVFTVMMFSAFLTLIGTLVADLLYAVVDPRISYK